MAQDDKKILSGALHVSGTMYHMIVIYGTLLQNDDISRFLFHFFKIRILRVVRGRGVKGLKMKKWSKMRKKFYLAPYLRNHTLYDFHLCCSYLK